jgi:hypothetical protein
MEVVRIAGNEPAAATRQNERVVHDLSREYGERL